LLYVSRWSSPEKAEEFAAIYSHSLPQRYKKAEEAEPDNSRNAAGDDGHKVEVLKGRHRWTTEEGTVTIEERGDTVLVSESLDAVTTERLEKEVFGK
jgi:hypothetical protein